MKLSDSVELLYDDGSRELALVDVFRIPNMYFRDDPEHDKLGLHVKTETRERCVTVNRKHERWHGTYDAIMQLIAEVSGKTVAGVTYIG